MKKKLLFSGLLASNIILTAQINPLPFHWANKTGSTGSDAAIQSVADPKGSTYVIGRFEGTVDLDPGSVVRNFTSVGGRDAYIQKFNPSGQLVWVKTFGGSSSDNASAITIDYYKNIYITGTYEGKIDLNPNAGVSNQTSKGRTDVFVIKLDSNGFFYWGKSFGGIELETARGIDVDNSGGISVVGGFKGTVDFDPNTGVFNQSSNPTVHAGYIVKLNSMGSLTWAKTIKGSASVSVSAVESWNSGDIVCSGTFGGTADFDPNAGVVNLTSNSPLSNACIFKLNSSGNLLWAKRIGTTSYTEAPDLAMDIQQNVYLIGTYSAYNTGDAFNPASYSLLLDVDPNSGVQNRTGTASANLYIVSLDKNGFYRWDYTLKANFNTQIPSGVTGLNIETEICGNIYFTGTLTGTADADPGSNVQTISSPSGQSAAILGKLNVNGLFLGAVTLGNTGSTITAGHVSTDYYGNAYVTGNFTKTIDFNPSTSTFNLTSTNSTSGTSSTDGFLGKYGVHQWAAREAAPDATVTLNEEIMPEGINVSLKMYPNPAKEVLYIQSNETGKLEIYSITGQLISSEILNAGIAQKNITDLNSGTYITRFISSQGVTTSRILIGE